MDLISSLVTVAVVAAVVAGVAAVAAVDAAVDAAVAVAVVVAAVAGTTGALTGPAVVAKIEVNIGFAEASVEIELSEASFTNPYISYISLLEVAIAVLLVYPVLGPVQGPPVFLLVPDPRGQVGSREPEKVLGRSPVESLFELFPEHRTPFEL